MSTQPLTPGARPEPSLPPAPTLATIVSVNDGPRPRSSAILYLGLAVVGIAVLASTLAFLGNFRLSHATMAQAPKVPQGTPIDPPAERLARFDIKPAAPTVSVAQVAAPEVLINAALPVVAPPVRDRYNGGIVIEPPVVAAKEAPKESLTLPDPPQEALDVLRRADLSQWGGAAIVGALGNAASAHTDARTDSKRQSISFGSGRERRLQLPGPGQWTVLWTVRGTNRFLSQVEVTVERDDIECVLDAKLADVQAAHAEALEKAQARARNSVK